MLKRGFKRWSENTAISYRKDLELNKTDALCPFNLAQHLNIKLINPLQLRQKISAKNLNILLEKESGSWSAVTISKDSSHAIIYNSSHAKTRQANDIMHELSHVIIGHKPQTVHHSHDTNMWLRQYNKNQEDEANCLAAALLLPRTVLINIKSQRMSLYTASKIYGVSQSLIGMRLNISGVNRIYKNRAI